MGFNPAVLRLVRLIRLTRLRHVLRSMAIFDSCILICRSLRASIGALFWSTCFILVIILLAAFLLNALLVQHFRGYAQSVAADVHLELFLKFGTITRTMVTMFEMTLGNWGPPTWLLFNNVGEGWALFMIPYKLVAGFAAINVINAVFLRTTMKQAENIDDKTIQQAKNDAERYCKRVGELFDHIDRSGDGKLSREEFKGICQSKSLRAWMKLLNVSVHDIDALWVALDDGNGFIDRDRFLNGFSKLDGPASTVDAMKIIAMLRELRHAPREDVVNRPTLTTLKIGL